MWWIVARLGGVLLMIVSASGLSAMLYLGFWGYAAFFVGFLGAALFAMSGANTLSRKE